MAGRNRKPLSRPRNLAKQAAALPRLLQRGDWIATGEGWLGMIVQVHPHLRTNYYLCKFGPDGPFRTMPFEDLRHATQDEINYMEGQTFQLKRSF